MSTNITIPFDASNIPNTIASGSGVVSASAAANPNVIFSQLIPAGETALKDKLTVTVYVKATNAAGGDSTNTTGTLTIGTTTLRNIEAGQWGGSNDTFMKYEMTYSTAMGGRLLETYANGNPGTATVTKLNAGPTLGGALTLELEMTLPGVTTIDYTYLYFIEKTPGDVNS